MLHVPSVLSTGSGLSESLQQSPSNKGNSAGASQNVSVGQTPNSRVQAKKITPNTNDNSQFPSNPPAVPFDIYNSDDDDSDDPSSSSAGANARKNKSGRRRSKNMKNQNLSASTESFDMLDQISESIHAICVGMNRDGSRIFAGHDFGFTVWHLETPLPGKENDATTTHSGTTSAPSTSTTTATSTSTTTGSSSSHIAKAVKTPHSTITLGQMFGRSFIDCGGKGFVFCASVLNRTEYFVCGVKTKIKDVESEEVFVLHGREVRHKLMSRVAAEGGVGLRDVGIEQDRIFVMCTNSFHLFDLAGRPLMNIPSSAEIPSAAQLNFSVEGISRAVTQTASKATKFISGLFWGASTATSSSSGPDPLTIETKSPAFESALSRPAVPPPLPGSKGHNNKNSSDNTNNNNNTNNVPTCGTSSSNQTVFSSGSDRPAHIQQHTTVLSILSGADEDTMSVCAFPGKNHPGSFTVVDWHKREVITKKDVQAHAGRLACVKISMGSGNVKLLAVTASTTGTTCRLWNALEGIKLRDLRMCTPFDSFGSAPSTFKLRGLELDRFGRVVVLCQDSSTSSSAATETIPKTSFANLGGATLANSSFTSNPTSTTTPTSVTRMIPSSGPSSANPTSFNNLTSANNPDGIFIPKGGKNALELLFFDADDPQDGLAPVAGAHDDENRSFARKYLTTVAGQKATDAATALRPMSRFVLPLRQPSANNSLATLHQQSSGDVTSSSTSSNSIQPSLPQVVSEEGNSASGLQQNNDNNNNNQQQEQATPASGAGQFNIEELICGITLTGDPKFNKYVVTPDCLPIAVARIHASGVRSIAQITFSGLPRADVIVVSNNNNNQTIVMPNSSLTSDSEKKPSAIKMVEERMGIDIKNVRDKLGNADLDVLKPF